MQGPARHDGVRVVAVAKIKTSNAQAMETVWVKRRRNTMVSGGRSMMRLMEANHGCEDAGRVGRVSDLVN